jgi:metabolite-proton symporter
MGWVEHEMSGLEKITLRIAVASFVGTAIEFYDLYAYGTAAAIVFGPIFFPASSEAAQLLNALATFAIAFIARPIGSAIFGHFGDRKGRKTTLVASLLIMGVCTTLIGMLPGYNQIGAYAPIALCILRFGQGIGFGGEWAGAALLVVENAPVNRRAWFAMFPQLGGPIGFIAANAVFLVLAETLDADQFRNWGWRLPFLFSAVLVLLGLYVRLKLVETPIFKRMLDREAPVRVPLGELFRHYGGRTILGSLAMVACYALFYLSTVFSLGYGTTVLKMSRPDFLALECVAIIGMVVAIPISAMLCDRFGRHPVLLVGLALTALSGTLYDRMLGSGSVPIVTTFLFLELFLMGLIFAPMGAFLPELFPTRVRYTGASITYNLGGILGASFAPYIAQSLANRGGLPWVGAYLAIACVISFGAVLLLGETAGTDLADQMTNANAEPQPEPITVRAGGADLPSSAA